MIPIVHHPAYQAEIPADHRFPMGKFRRLAEVLVEDGIVSPGSFHAPEPAAREALVLAHDAAYVDAVIEGRVPAAVAREIGFPMSESVARRARAATGGRCSPRGSRSSTGSRSTRRAGAITPGGARGGLLRLQRRGRRRRGALDEGRIGRVLVIDLDVHQGDGTADIFAGDGRVFTLSLHAERNYPVRKIPSTLDVGLPDGLDDAGYLDALEAVLDRVILTADPDLVFYNAGVDPHEADRLGRLKLTDRGLAARDARVLEAVRGRGRPLCGVIGGGYDTDIDRLARRHSILHRTALAFR